MRQGSGTDIERVLMWLRVHMPPAARAVDRLIVGIVKAMQQSGRGW